MALRVCPMLIQNHWAFEPSLELVIECGLASEGHEYGYLCEAKTILQEANRQLLTVLPETAAVSPPWKNIRLASLCIHHND